MKNYLKNENIFQIAAIRYQRQLWLCILFGSNQTILYIFLKFKKWRRDEGRQTKSEIVMHKILIILSAGTKLSVVLLNVTPLFFSLEYYPIQLVFCISECNGMVIISKVKSTHNGLSWGWWLVFSITPRGNVISTSKQIHDICMLFSRKMTILNHTYIYICTHSPNARFIYQIRKSS